MPVFDGTEPALFVPKVAKQHGVFVCAIAFEMRVSVRASFFNGEKYSETNCRREALFIKNYILICMLVCSFSQHVLFDWNTSDLSMEAAEL